MTGIDKAKKNLPARKRRQVREVSWDDVEPSLIVAAIVAMSDRGDALRFGLTRDRSSYALGIYQDGESETTYSHDPVWMQQELIDLVSDQAASKGEDVDG